MCADARLYLLHKSLDSLLIDSNNIIICTLIGCQYGCANIQKHVITSISFGITHKKKWFTYHVCTRNNNRINCFLINCLREHVARASCKAMPEQSCKTTRVCSRFLLRLLNNKAAYELAVAVAFKYQREIPSHFKSAWIKRSWTAFLLGRIFDTINYLKTLVRQIPERWEFNCFFFLYWRCITWA